MYWADEAKLEIAKQLKEVFGNDLVRAEWRSSAKNEDWLKFGKVYAPRPDIAVGPFNTSTQDIERTVGEIRQKFDEKKIFSGCLIFAMETMEIPDAYWQSK